MADTAWEQQKMYILGERPHQGYFSFQEERASQWPSGQEV